MLSQAHSPAIPETLKRSVLVEGGHRCAIPTRNATTTEIAYIVRKAMVQYKANIGVLNGRYSDLDALTGMLAAAHSEGGSMSSFGLVFPVLPGKEPVVRELGSQLKERRSEYTQSRERGGVTFERAYLQKNPDGTSLAVTYLEADRGFGEAMKELLSSDIPLDRYFIEKNKEATGIDFGSGPPGPDPELVGAWVAPGATQRGKGLAFAAPLQPGKTDAARQFATEAYVTRRTEMAESRSSKGLIREEVFLNQTPAGDVVVVYLEGNDPVDGNRQFAASNTPFDRWFKDRCKEVFAPFINFDQPVPQNEEIFSSA